VAGWLAGWVAGKELIIMLAQLKLSLAKSINRGMWPSFQPFLGNEIHTFEEYILLFKFILFEKNVPFMYHLHTFTNHTNTHSTSSHCISL
jgi:hypothetical protein